MAPDRGLPPSSSSGSHIPCSLASCARCHSPASSQGRTPWRWRNLGISWLGSSLVGLKAAPCHGRQRWCSWRTLEVRVPPRRPVLKGWARALAHVFPMDCGEEPLTARSPHPSGCVNGGAVSRYRQGAAAANILQWPWPAFQPKMVFSQITKIRRELEAILENEITQASA